MFKIKLFIFEQFLQSDNVAFNLNYYCDDKLKCPDGTQHALCNATLVSSIEIAVEIEIINLNVKRFVF